MSAKVETTARHRFVWPAWAEWKRALLWPYAVFTLLIALSLAGSFVSYERVLTAGHPWLPAKREHPPCVFCGLTRSFCAMSAGRVKEANEWNRGGPALYTFGWLWLAGSFVLFIRRQPRR
jgi:hypothetical protein